MGPIVDDINVVNMPSCSRTRRTPKDDGRADRQELLDKITASPNANLVRCAGWIRRRSLYNTSADQIDRGLKGLKFRVIGNPIFIDMMNALGGNGVAMATIRCSAPCRRVIDGAENNTQATSSATLYDGQISEPDPAL